MRATIMTQTINFFRTEAAAKAMAEANGGEVNGFFAVAAKGREDRFVVEVRVEDDGSFLGYL